MRPLHVRFVWPTLLLLAGCAGLRSPTAPVTAFAPGDPLEGAQWALLAVDLTTGDTVVERDAGKRMIPASTMKIATMVAALDLLGSTYQWRTELWSTGPVDSAGATLNGDLVLPGTGDPTLSERFWTKGYTPLDVLAGSVADQGVRHVTGALVIDASRWDSATVRASWMVDDLPFDYSATGGAFALAEGETHVEVRGGAMPGQPVQIRWWPFGEDGFVRNRLTTDTTRVPDVEASFLPESHALELTGTVPAGLVDTLAFATRDPIRQSAAALYRALRERGVTIDGGWRIEWDPGKDWGRGCVTGSVPPCPAGRALSRTDSPPLTEVIAGVLGPSQNWIAEQIVRTLGDARTGRSSWPDGTAAAERDLTEVVGLRPLDIRFMDGSGLSVQDLLTPRALVQLLRHARAQPWGAAFRAALPEPGEPNTTLTDRLTDLSGRLWAKTGSLTNVATFAGYVTDARGHEIAFAVMVNGSNLPAGSVRSGIDAAVRSLAARR